MRLAVDTGGTFTDLVVEEADGTVSMHKSQTTPDDPVRGVLDVLRLAAGARGEDLAAFLGRGDVFVHGTTRATNAVLTGATARTALLATIGHHDLLLLREAGKFEPFNWTREYGDPYIPRALSFEVPERIGSEGKVVMPLDEDAVAAVCARLRELEVEAVAVCLLWSIVNPAHELRVGELLDEHLPGVPFTLSHRLNPVMREYRRGSSTAIDASLKPVMGAYLHGLESRLREAGFGGRVLVVSANGGVLDAEEIADSPIHSLNSGPAMAPLAGRYYAERESQAETAVVADTGGTSYDVSLVRRGRIPMTRETWLGEPFISHITGFPSVDVKSIGAGGGSIAWIDKAGMLHVGPRSAGAAPGPVCYGRGGTEPTVTDACLVLGYLDPDYFLGGAMALDLTATERAVEEKVARPLGMSVPEAAAAIVAVATELMVDAIEMITVEQGVDPREAVLVGGGGAAGLNSVAIARRLGCREVVIPAFGAALSAAGALMSDLATEFAAVHFTRSDELDAAAANAVLEELEARCHRFRERAGGRPDETTIGFVAEARYLRQVWQIDVPMPSGRFETEADAAALWEAFHVLHEELYAVRDERSPIEIVNLRARVSVRIRERFEPRLPRDPSVPASAGSRRLYFRGHGWVDGEIRHVDGIADGDEVAGPAVIESSFTTVVVEPGSTAVRRPGGSLVVRTPAAAPSPVAASERRAT